MSTIFNWSLIILVNLIFFVEAKNCVFKIWFKTISPAHSLWKGITVLDVILEAGGVSPFANADKSKLYRQTKEGAKVYPIYLNDILEKGILDSNYTLYPQDIITVPERGF